MISPRLILIVSLIHLVYCKENGEGHFTIFTQSIGSMLVSEIGDKTFFLAAILSMKFNRYAVWAGAAGALVLMTAISCLFGMIVPSLLPKFYTSLIVTFIFYFFAGKLLYDWYHMENDGDKEELKEVEQELMELDKKLLTSHKIIADGEQQLSQEEQIKSLKNIVPLQHIAWQAFIMTFLGEWGDRSQITTISLAAIKDADIVFLGASLGHLICTTIAVLGGKLIADRISEKTVNLVGGLVFLLFALMHTYGLIVGEEEE